MKKISGTDIYGVCRDRRPASATRPDPGAPFLDSVMLIFFCDGRSPSRRESHDRAQKCAEMDMRARPRNVRHVQTTDSLLARRTGTITLAALSVLHRFHDGVVDDESDGGRYEDDQQPIIAFPPRLRSSTVRRPLVNHLRPAFR